MRKSTKTIFARLAKAGSPVRHETVETARPGGVSQNHLLPITAVLLLAVVVSAPQWQGALGGSGASTWARDFGEG